MRFWIQANPSIFHGFFQATYINKAPTHTNAHTDKWILKNGWIHTRFSTWVKTRVGCWQQIWRFWTVKNIFSCISYAYKLCKTENNEHLQLSWVIIQMKSSGKWSWNCLFGVTSRHSVDAHRHLWATNCRPWIASWNVEKSFVGNEVCILLVHICARDQVQKWLAVVPLVLCCRHGAQHVCWGTLVCHGVICAVSLLCKENH